MRPLIRRTIITLFLAIVICAVISTTLSAFMPTFTNQMAMGQLENDDFAFAAWTMWSNVQNSLYAAEGIVWLVAAIFIGKDVYKYFKTRKENN